MQSADGSNPEADPYRPPAVSVEVRCLHCDREYQSSLIKWIEQPADGDAGGAWCCPTKGCSGKGFGLDILPTDLDADGDDDSAAWQVDDLEFGNADDMEDIEQLDALVDVGEVNELAEIDELTGQPSGQYAPDIASVADDDDSLW